MSSGVWIFSDEYKCGADVKLNMTDASVNVISESPPQREDLLQIYGRGSWARLDFTGRCYVIMPANARAGIEAVYKIHDSPDFKDGALIVRILHHLF